MDLIFKIPFFVSAWAVAAQRCRDFGWTGWAVLISLLLYIGTLFSIVIIFIPGNLGENQYWEDPLKIGPTKLNEL